MKSPRALLLRVAVDKTRAKKQEKFWSRFKNGYPNAGFWGPLWKDGEKFEYIPVPEIKTTHYGWRATEYLEGEPNDDTYRNSIGMRLGKPLIETINNIPERPQKDLSNIAIHNDPNFETLTYGDIPPKGRKCSDLRGGDLLVFCTCLQDFESRSKYHRVFIIGYFTVKAVYDFEEICKTKRKEVASAYKDANAHFSSAFARSWGGAGTTREELLNTYINSPEDAPLVLVVGFYKRNGVRVSGLLRKAVKLTEKFGGESCYIPEATVKSLGLKKTPGRLLYKRGSKRINWDRKNRRQIDRLREILAKGEPFCRMHHASTSSSQYPRVH